MVYWFLFFGWVIYAYITKKCSLHHLWIAFGLFTLAALLKTVSLDNLAEPLMRISLLGWLIGMTIAIKEYQRN